MSTFVFDLDGTLYRGNIAIEGAVAVVNELRDYGHKVVFSTNDATRTLSERKNVLNALGFPVEPQGLMTSAYGTALYLNSLPCFPCSILVLGSDALIQEIRNLHPCISINQMEPFDAVIVSFDLMFSYEKLTKAQHAVLSGAHLIATNRDPLYPGLTQVYPGAGAFVAAVEAACLTTASTVGKPNSFTYDLLISLNNADPQTTIVIGDNMSTDIAAAAPSKLFSVLVLSGVTKDPPAMDASPYPDLIIPSVQDLIPALQRIRPGLLESLEQTTENW